MPAPKTALPVCPVEVTLALISDRWKVLILRDLMQDTRRFGELKRSVGHISQKVLTTNLRSMEQSGLINRHVYAEVPPRVEYTLTAMGESFLPVLNHMLLWSETHLCPPDYVNPYQDGGCSPLPGDDA